MQTDFLLSLVIVFGVSAILVFLLHKIKIPSVLGFLTAGVIIGPHGFGLIDKQNEIEIFAEVGVILLLFTLGVEFSLKKLLRMKKIVFGAGTIQLLLTIAFTSFLTYFIFENLAEAVFAGFLVSLSSTAIVMKILAVRNETQSPHGRAMIGILLFQDICVVLFMIMIPVLSGENDDIKGILWILAKALLIIIVVLSGARWLVPYILHQIVKTRSRELFIISIILLCVGTALFTNEFGLSLSLGAFLAGMIISESEYAYQATADVVPFKESFMGLFFVSIGMLLNTGFLLTNLPLILLIVIILFLLKTSVGYLASIVIRLTHRTSLVTGLGLSQIGEFSFVLALSGKMAGLINEEVYQIFLSASILTMMATPFVMKYAPSFSAWLLNKISPHYTESHKELLVKSKIQNQYANHVIIIGFGFNGRNLAKIFYDTDIPYVIIESNNETVRLMKKEGEPIFFGDASGSELLIRMGIRQARLLVCTVEDPITQRSIISISKQINPLLHIIVRTRYISSVEDLKKLGANDVIPEEFETAVELIARTMEVFNFPPGVVDSVTSKIRTDNYAALRKKDLQKKQLFSKQDCLPKIDIDGFLIPENSQITGKTIKELSVREKTGATIIAVRRDGDVNINPSPDFTFVPGDIVLYTGNRESMDKLVKYFKEYSSY